MMANEIFLVGLGLGCALLLAWGFKTLPQERWQILAAIPIYKNGDGTWRGINLTFYGLFTANAMAVAATILVIMLGSLGLSLREVGVVLLPLISLCAPAARLVARVVEKKPYTFTVAGAFFVGLIAAPWLVLAANLALGPQIELPALAVCAALAVAYAFGEGLGRLACISFGCCYGKPLDQCPPALQKLFAHHNFAFRGATKKASYESGLEGSRLVPVQALTAVLYLACGLASLYLFLLGWFAFALMLCLTVTQGWRAFSEFLRADFRGHGSLTAYQWMALISVAYAGLMALWLPQGSANPELFTGLALLWDPWILIMLQGLWVAVLLYTGRSKVTASTISFMVMQDRI
jgi:hypothetical protein